MNLKTLPRYLNIVNSNWLKNVTQLDIRQNGLTEIDSDFVKTFVSLASLDAGMNQIKYVTPDIELWTGLI